MKIIDSKLKDFKGGSFEVYKTEQSVTIMKFSDSKWIDNNPKYTDLFLGKCNACESFYKDSFNNFEYKSVMVAGLGFGLIPTELSEVNNLVDIDVIEINKEVIEYNILSGHLSNDINIIESDVFEYVTEKKYDLIIIDTIWKEEEMSEDQVDLLVSKFLNTNLNTGGVLYIPVLEKWLINK